MNELGWTRLLGTLSGFGILVAGFLKIDLAVIAIAGGVFTAALGIKKIADVAIAKAGNGNGNGATPEIKPPVYHKPNYDPTTNTDAG